MNLKGYRTAVFTSKFVVDNNNNVKGEYKFIFSPQISEEEMREFAKSIGEGDVETFEVLDKVDLEYFKEYLNEDVQYGQRTVLGYSTEYYTEDGYTTEYCSGRQRKIDDWI